MDFLLARRENTGKVKRMVTLILQQCIVIKKNINHSG